MTTLTLELGAKRFWRDHRPGRWDKKVNGAETTWTHIPAKHDIKVPDSEVAGLKAKSRQWEEANKMQRAEGDLVRMFRVSNVKRTDEADPPAMMPPMMKAIDHIVEKVIAVLNTKK